MKLFIDTANVEDIRRANDLGVICGVTTNPSLIAKEGRDFVEVVKEIAEIVDGPISAEVISVEADKMVTEALELYRTINNKNLVIKIPMCAEGLKATKQLAAMGIKTNVTLIFSTAQALLAAKAGIDLVEDIVKIFRNYAIKTEIISASIRSSNHVIEVARVGSDIATVPYKIIESMIQHPLTVSGIQRFLDDWAKVE